MNRSEALAKLGLAQDATNSQIKDRYHELSKLYHPDVNKTPDSSTRMSEINEAYEIVIPKTNVKWEKGDNDIVFVQTLQSDLLNNFPSFKDYRSKQEETMNLYLKGSNENYDKLILNMLNEGAMINRESMIEYLRENGYSLSGAKGTAETNLLIVRKWRRENL